MYVIASNLNRTPKQYASQIVERALQNKPVKDISMGSLGLCHQFTATSLRNLLTRAPLPNIYVVVLTRGDFTVHSVLMTDTGIIADRDKQYRLGIVERPDGLYIQYDYTGKVTELKVNSFILTKLIVEVHNGRTKSNRRQSTMRSVASRRLDTRHSE